MTTKTTSADVIEYREDEENIRCECGKITGERCASEPPLKDTVEILWLPPYLRDSYRAAGRTGDWCRSSDVVRLRAEISCARRLLDDEDEMGWIEEVR